MSLTTKIEYEEAKEQYESAVKSIEFENWAEDPVVRKVFEETTDPYHAFISDLGVRDGGNGKTDQLYANAYEFAHVLRTMMAETVIGPSISTEVRREVWESYDDPGANPLTHEHAFEVMRRAEEEGHLLATDSRVHVYHPETRVVDD